MKEPTQRDGVYDHLLMEKNAARRWRLWLVVVLVLSLACSGETSLGAPLPTTSPNQHLNSSPCAANVVTSTPDLVFSHFSKVLPTSVRDWIVISSCWPKVWPNILWPSHDLLSSNSSPDLYLLFRSDLLHDPATHKAFQWMANFPTVCFHPGNSIWAMTFTSCQDWVQN